MALMKKFFPLTSLSPEGLRRLAQDGRRVANSPNPSLMPVQRVKLRQKAKLVEWWADRKAKRHARQNRHPDHLTKQ
jgi:hypothetical protein